MQRIASKRKGRKKFMISALQKMKFKRRKPLWEFIFLAMISFWSCLVIRHQLKLGKTTSKKKALPATNNPECKIPHLESYLGRSPPKPNTYSRRAARIPETRLHVDTTDDEKKCPKLYEIARAMLDGEKIKLPYETNNTRWKFREGVDLGVLTKTNYPWEQSDSTETQRKRQIYNDVLASSIPARKYVLTYGHNCCEMSKRRAVNQAIDVGKVDYAEALDLSHLSVPFQISHQNILRHRKGTGYWLWKSYIILKTLLTKLNDGDLLFYHDAGVYVINDTGPLFKLCIDTKPNIITFRQPCKQDVLDKIRLRNDHQKHQKKETERTAALQVYMKSCTTIQFAMEYLAYSADYKIVNNDKSFLDKPNMEGIRDKNHGDALLTLLSKKWGIRALQYPCACNCGRNKSTQNYKFASGLYQSLCVQDGLKD